MKTVSAIFVLCVVLASEAHAELDTLYRGQIPLRPPTTDKPRVENPDDYDEYVSPDISGGGPLVVPHSSAVPAHPPPPPPPPKYIPKPFVPRQRKKVQKLRPSGPLLHPAADSKYEEPRYGKDIQDFSSIPGKPGDDYPVYNHAPETGFTCDKVPHRPGLYADIDTRCQSYHVCEVDNRHGYGGATFLCTNGTVFNQQELTCDWWYNVNCAESKSLYGVNLDPYKNPYLPKPEEQKPAPGQYV